MESYVETLAKSYFLDHRASFGEDSILVRFEQNSEVRSVNMCHLTYKFYIGRIVHRRLGEFVYSYRNLLIRYFEATAEQPGLLVGLVPHTRELDFWQSKLPILDSWKPIKHLFLEFCMSCTTGTLTSNQTAILWQRPSWSTDFEAVSSLAFGYRYCSLMVRRIAELHACSLHMEVMYKTVFDSLNCADPEPMFFDTESVLEMLHRCLQPLYNDIHFKNHHRQNFQLGVSRLESMLETFNDFLSVPFVRSSTASHCWVLCHQNYGQQSVLFDHDQTGVPIDLKIFNCQSMGFASLGLDLAIPLFVELDGISINKFFDALLTEYYAQLQLTGCNFVGPSLECVKAEVKKSIPFALYALANRIVQAESENSFFSSIMWNEDRITNLYRYLIVAQLL